MKKDREPYLSRALGSNGVKEAQKVKADRHKASLQNEFSRVTSSKSWEEAKEMYPEAAEQIDRLAVCDKMKSKTPKYFPAEVYDLAKRAMNYEELPIGTIDIKYKVLIDGKEIYNKDILNIVNKHKKIKEEINIHLKDEN